MVNKLILKQVNSMITKLIKSNKLFKKITIYIFNKIKFRKSIKGELNVIKNYGFSNVRIKVMGSNNIIVIKRDCILKNCDIFINGNGNLIHIYENCRLKNSQFWIEDYNCKIEIGKDTTTEGVHFACTEANSIIKIGEDCMFSYGIELRTGDSHSIIDKNNFKRINYAKNIKISDHVWVGAKAIILKGVCIGEDSIVATGTIVTKSVENNCIVGGIPAKILKEDITWNRERMPND